MEYPEYTLPQDQAEREVIKQDIIKFVSERCRLKQEEISSYISTIIEPKLDGTYQNPYGRQLKINFQNNDPKELVLNPKTHFILENRIKIQRILSEDNPSSVHFIREKTRKLHQHKLGYDEIKSTKQLSSNYNFVDRIDYVTYMKRLLIESGNTHSDYQWKVVLGKLYIDLLQPQTPKTESEERKKFNLELQNKQLLSRKKKLEAQLSQINMMLDINEKEFAPFQVKQDLDRMSSN